MSQKFVTFITVISRRELSFREVHYPFGGIIERESIPGRKNLNAAKPSLAEHAGHGFNRINLVAQGDFVQATGFQVKDVISFYGNLFIFIPESLTQMQEGRVAP